MKDDRSNILVVDDDAGVLESISVLLTVNGYSVTPCENAKAAIAKVQANSIDIVLTDIRMPGISGIGLLEKIHSLNPELPVILMTAYTELNLAINAIESGAFNFIVKPYNTEYLLNTIKKAAQHNRLIRMERNYKQSLEETLRKRTQEIVDLNMEIIKRLTAVAEFRDSDTGSHISRIGLYSSAIAEWLDMPKDFIENMAYAGSLHDIGKIGIHDEILLKQGPLTSEEFEVMKTHTLIGEKMLTGSSHSVLEMAASVALNHHERWDCTGYPRGLKGEDCPIEGRIVLICDQYDALVSKRPYKSAFSHEKTFNILTKGDGRTMPEHFDPKILNSFIELAHKFKEIHGAHCD